MTISRPMLLAVLRAIFACTALAGCTQLPVDGPGYRAIHTGAAATLSNGRDPLLVYTARDAVQYNYALIDVNPLVLSVLDGVSPSTFYRTFGSAKSVAPAIRIGIGDTVQTSIFESSAGGLFVAGDAAGRAGNYVALPAQTVGSNGTISIPYAGQIKAAGRTPYEVQHDIEKKLAARAIEPQVIVNITEQNADSVTVIGDAGQNRIKLTGSGERILDIISKGGGGGGPGGSKLAAYELMVTLRRQSRVGTLPLTSIIESPQENIYVEPGDVIYVHRETKQFVAIGALSSTGGGAVSGGDTAGLTGLFSFGQERLSLNEAIAKAGGISDGRANPSQIFLYRGERRETLERMGVSLANFAPNQESIPTVYRANFRDPAAFFMAQKFQMRDRDILYVANADSIEVAKVLNYMTLWTSSAAGYVGSAAGILTSAQVLGGGSTGTAFVVGSPVAAVTP